MQPEQPESKGIAISAEAYNAVIEQITPLDIRLTGMRFQLRAAVHSGPLQASARMDEPTREPDRENGDGSSFVHIRHDASFEIASTDGSKAAEGAATFLVVLRVGFKAPESFWPIFLKRNVKLYTHPALRDLIASLSARAGLVVQPLSSISITQSIIRALPPPSDFGQQGKASVE